MEDTEEARRSKHKTYIWAHREFDTCTGPAWVKARTSPSTERGSGHKSQPSIRSYLQLIATSKEKISSLQWSIMRFMNHTWGQAPYPAIHCQHKANLMVVWGGFFLSHRALFELFFTLQMFCYVLCFPIYMGFCVWEFMCLGDCMCFLYFFFDFFLIFSFFLVYFYFILLLFCLDTYFTQEREKDTERHGNRERERVWI